MDITNASGGDITITRFFTYWDQTPTSQKISELQLGGVTIWNPSDPDSPTDIPLEGNWVNGANLTITNGGTSSLLILFAENLQATGYEVHVVFDIGCQVSDSL